MNLKILSLLFLTIPALAADRPPPSAAFQAFYKKMGYSLDKKYFNATEQQVQDMNVYTEPYDSYYPEINDYLRYYPKPYEWTGTSPKDAQRIVESIDGIFDLVPELPARLILYRGVTLKWRQNRSFNVGDEFDDRAYISTSISRSVAVRFSKGVQEGQASTDRHAVFTLYFDQSHEKGILIYSDEDEVLLKHRRHFRIMKKAVNGNSDSYLVQICGYNRACSHQAPNLNFN